MIGLLKRLFCSIPDPSLPYAAAATSLTSSLMYQANRICASPCSNYFRGDGACTIDAAVGHWLLAISQKRSAILSTTAISRDPRDSSALPRAAGPPAAKPNGLALPICFDLRPICIPVSQDISTDDKRVAE